MEKYLDEANGRIAQLEAQIMELFRMLKEVGKDVETIINDAGLVSTTGGMDRKALVEQLERNWQRTKTIRVSSKDST